MKKQFANLKARSLFIATLFFCSGLLFSGCENFLKGSDTKQRLDEKVAYANAQSCTVYIHANDREGTFLSSGEKVFKVGFAEELQFNLNTKDFSFVKFRAVSINNHTAIGDEYISFSTIDYNWQTGVFKVSVKILKARNDIMIQPVCREKSENTAPQTKELFATKDLVTLDTKDSASYSKILPGTNANYTADYVYEHHTGACINILGTYFDEGSGFACLNVKDRIIIDKNAVSVVRSKEWDTQNVYKESDQTDIFSCQTDDDGNTAFCLKYTISGDDGLHELLISAVDACGNESEVKVIQVFKDTNLSLNDVYPFNYNPYKDYPGFKCTTDYFEFDRAKFNAELKTIKILSSTQSSYYDTNSVDGQYYYIEKTLFKSQIFGNVNKKADSLTFWCEYNGTKARMNYNSEDYYWYLTIDESMNIEGLELKICVEDDCGNVAHNTYAFAGKPIVSGIETEDNLYYGKITRINFASNYNYTRFWQFNIKDYGTSNQKVIGNYGAGEGWSIGVVYQNLYEGNGCQAFYPVLMNGCLTGPFYDTPFTADIQFTNNSPDFTSPEIESVSFGEVYYTQDIIGDYKYYYPLIIRFSENVLINDTDIVSVTVTHSYESGKIVAALPQKSNILTIYSPYLSSGSVWMEGQHYIVSAIGIKGNKSSVPTVKNIDSLRGTDKDTVPPRISFTEKLSINSLVYKLSDYKECFMISDLESGLDAKSIYYTLNEKKYTKDLLVKNRGSGTQSDLLIPVWDVDGPAASFSIYGSDNNKNQSAIKATVKFFYPPAFKIEKSNTKYTLTATDSSEWVNWATNIYTLNSNSEWVKVDTGIGAPTHTQSTYQYTNVTLPSSSFIKVIAFATDPTQELSGDTSTGYCNYGYSDPVIYYTGTASKKNQFFDGYNGVLIASDQPVFVQTFTTKTDYETCKNWTYAKWNHNHRHISEQYMTTNNNLQMYEIDIDDIEEGECYVVAAHYADNTVKLSSVKQK